MHEPLRRLSMLDRFLSHVDTALHNIFCEQRSSRAYPAEGIEEGKLNEGERKASAAMMRVNHAGEISAQALYQGQSICARDPSLRASLKQASIEEADHLNWCRRRLEELHDRTSYLDPFWYIGSLAIGIAAGLAGDRWNLGFLSETERQVVRHLDGHLERLPQKDERSRAIVSQMREDELGHAMLAEQLGAAPLPLPVRKAMRATAKIMTTLAARI